MKKAVDEIKTLNGEGSVQQLTDDESGFASGGESPDGEDKTRVCPKCGFVYFASGNKYEREYYRRMHSEMHCDEPI